MSGAAAPITLCAVSNSVVIDHKFSGQISVMRTDTKCHTRVTMKIQSGVPGTRGAQRKLIDLFPKTQVVVPFMKKWPP